MQNIDIPLLSAICKAPGAPGFEREIRNLILKEVKLLSNNVTLDNMGNITVTIPGKSEEKLMLAAHMDEIGFIVTHIDKQGFVRFHTLGGFDPKTLTAQRVLIHGKKSLVGVMGSKPIHVMSDAERTKSPKTTDYFIDLGMNKEEVEKYISVGDSITRERDLIEMGDCVNCKSIDNRVSVYVLIELLKKLQNTTPPVTVCAVFTVQEEVGIRGASVATQTIKPSWALAIDTTIAFDVPGAADHEKITELGKGVAIKIMDTSAICDYRMIANLKTVAEQNKITYQTEILTGGGTDTMALQRMTAGGSIAGAISIPTRHIHQVIEMAHKQDIANAIMLLHGFITEIDQLPWKHD
ncbi:MAG: putative aminopeptidase FrvX [Flavobacteriales bacterium]|jgi:putative aminopeptidase FrvX